jgi:hypothetical protein
MGRLTFAAREAAVIYWRQHIDAWKISGLSQISYCQQQGILLKNFTNWRGKLKSEDAAATAAPRWRQYKTGKKLGRSRPAGTTVVIERPAPAIEVELVDGRKVRFGRDTDPELIRRVLDAIEMAKLPAKSAP